MANLNIEAQKANTYDAIVIGSGISGGYAAKELTEKGLKVLMLERGKMLNHIADYEAAMKNPWEFSYNGQLTVEQKERSPKLARDYPYNEMTADYWFRDQDSMYVEKKRFDWYRPDIVGGKSIMWGRQCYRLSDLDFEANAKDGYGVDWPIRYKDIEPWYTYVEKFAGISGEALGLPQLPDSHFLPPMEMTFVEKEVRKRIEKNFPGRHMTIGRVANLSAAKEEQLGVGRGPCQHRNRCQWGCPFGAYFSTQSATLPAATATGNLTLRPDSIVREIVFDNETQKATGVSVIDSQTMEEREFHAPIVFVCASTVGTTSILLNSISDRFPNGFGNDSGELGHNLMDHHFRAGARGTWEGDHDRYIYGHRPNGIYVPRFANVGDDKRDFLRGFGYQGGGLRGNWKRSVAELSFGEDFKNEIVEPGDWSMGLGGFGETLPYHENRMWLDKNNLDKWGLPVVAFDAEFKENELKMREAIKNDAAEMLESAGLKNVKTQDGESFPGTAIHEMGTARMGKDPETSVCNGNNQVHAAKNVFLTDGACMTSVSCVNPSLTFMALTARAVDFAVGEMKKGDL
ncbi:MAG: GMC family oxidoreductase [Verrucomicrobiales bacterium]|nr:GMC family oxidoreductase [Verrucomicrobiales bacterium]